MLKSKTRWEIHDPDEERCQALAGELDISPLLARLLYVRGITEKSDAERFLNTDVAHFHDPFLMDGMKAAVTRIRKAVETQEPILIYGDYDADGVTSTSLMVHTMKRLGARFDYYIPDRFTEGYGLNKSALDRAKEQGFSLVITVDTGISGVEEVAYAREIGLDVIVTDHHEPPEILPDAAVAVINPKKPDCPYPFKMLAGVGVAFKVAHALFGEPPLEWIEYAAIGTIADLVPLIDENRILAKLGLEALSVSKRPGIEAMKAVSGLEDKEITAEHVGFAIGPRINASGRLDVADHAVELLVSDDREKAKELAEMLDQYNRERQQLVQQIAKEAEELVERFEPEQRSFLVVAQKGWNEGVIGIVASRLVEKYYRPTIVLSIDEESGMAKGSARSIQGFDIYRALSTCRDLLPHFGGHPMAAGMSLEASDIEELRSRLNRLADEWLTEEDLIPVTRVDARCGLDEVTIEAIEEMHRLAPFGEGNPRPRFLIEGVELSGLRTIGREMNHIKCLLNKNGCRLDGVAFQKADLLPHISAGARVQVVGELAVNEWNGYRKPQMIVEDLSIPEIQVFDWRGCRDKASKLKEIAERCESCVVFFEESCKARLEPHFFAVPDLSFYHVDPGGKWKCVSPGRDRDKPDFTSLVFYDLPPSLQWMESILKKMHKLERVYCLYGEEEDRNRLSSLPKREQFKWLYGLFYKQKQLHVDQIVKAAGARGLAYTSVRFMLDVFEELGFVLSQGAAYQLVETPEKRDLTESGIYRRKKEQLDMATELMYASQKTLSEWIMTVIRPNYHAEEDTIHEL
ncbi:MAG: single-stranded-DNA-specific exonuclease RecJ [Bacillaceae bacterium]|nr:single-stranded-DNA-specific exonuclease RecJ [Bacillaceae bacterium]